uniref:Uncharacterized protein n=1 Tax=Alexandrium andersonii TaxID=327968 RepID=A0A7S2I9B4_9DINO|mmetsp:Transcript_80460/g.180023  ORF Transcript_80460/g.180023 Transcript_80460/m.180023 type:complete len:204 (+) Transcript_80460:63-674(+)
MGSKDLKVHGLWAALALLPLLALAYRDDSDDLGELSLDSGHPGHVQQPMNITSAANVSSTGAVPSIRGKGGPAKASIESSLLMHSEKWNKATPGCRDLVKAMGRDPDKTDLHQGECPEMGHGDLHGQWGCNFGCYCSHLRNCIVEAPMSCGFTNTGKTLNGTYLEKTCLSATIGYCKPNHFIYALIGGVVTLLVVVVVWLLCC